MEALLTQDFERVTIIETHPGFELITRHIRGGETFSYKRFFSVNDGHQQKITEPVAEITEDITERIIFLAGLSQEDLKNNLKRQKSKNASERYLNNKNPIGLIAMDVDGNFFDVRKIIMKEFPNYLRSYQDYRGRPRN